MPAGGAVRDDPWAWAKQLEDPERDVGDVEVEFAFKLRRLEAHVPPSGHHKTKKKKGNCTGNLACLMALGLDQWLEGAAGDDPAAETAAVAAEGGVRVEGSPVGLANLGNTCYAGAIVQLLYFNVRLREAVYLWKQPAEGGNNILAQLQMLFATLEMTDRQSVDPGDLLRELNLNDRQHDATEFGKWLLGQIGPILEGQNLPVVRDLFRGSCSNVTTCNGCGNESSRSEFFSEINLPLVKQAGPKKKSPPVTLEMCLGEFLQIEILEGANQYRCQVCQGLQDATRCIRLEQLPPVLNLQLNRYGYDKDGQKKKIRDVVAYPDTLDMSAFEPPPGVSPLYNLTGILVHDGEEANSGHYLAYLKEAQNGTWFSFSDHEVVDLGVDVPKLFPKKSYSPYYFTYQRSDVDQPSVSAKAMLSDSVLQQVEENIRKAVVEEAEKEEQRKQIFADMRKYCKELPYDPSAATAEDDMELEFVKTSFLKSFLQDPITAAPGDVSDMLCEHGLLDLAKLNLLKVVRAEAAQALFGRFRKSETVGGNKILGRDMLCRPCVVRRCLEVQGKLKPMKTFLVRVVKREGPAPPQQPMQQQQPADEISADADMAEEGFVVEDGSSDSKKLKTEEEEEDFIPPVNGDGDTNKNKTEDDYFEAFDALDPPVRRSTRNVTRRKELNGVSEGVEFELSANMKLFALKVKICDKFAVAPGDQQLLLGGQDLGDDRELTVGELNIGPGALIDLYVEEVADPVYEPETGFHSFL